MGQVPEKVMEISSEQTDKNLLFNGAYIFIAKIAKKQINKWIHNIMFGNDKWQEKNKRLLFLGRPL